MMFNNIRCWGLWSERLRELLFVDVDRKKVLVYRNMLPDFVKESCEVVRLDLAGCYKRTDA